MAAIQERRREVEQGVAGYTESEDSYIGSVSEDDINRQLDTRKAKFHPQKADIVSADSTSSSVVDKVIQVLVCDCGAHRAEEAHPEDIRAPIESFEAVSTEDKPSGDRESHRAEEEQHNWGSDRPEEEQHKRSSDPAGEEQQEEGTRATVESCEAVLAEDEPSHRRGVHGVPEEAPQEGSRAIVPGEEGSRASEEDSRAIVQFPELESTVESLRRAEEAQQEGKKDSVETMAQALSPQDESSHHSTFDKIKEKLREKEEQLHLKGEKGIEDDPHPELTFVRQEPNFDYKVSTEAPIESFDAVSTEDKPSGDRESHRAEEEQHNWGSDRPEEEQHKRSSDPAGEEQQEEGTRATVESCEAVLAEDEPSHRRGVHGVPEEAPQEGSRAIVSGEEGSRASEEDSRAIVQFPELESTVESLRRAEEAQQEGKKDSVETMAQALSPQDESSHHSTFDKIKEKLREKEEQLHLKGEKGIEDDPHPELTFVRQEPNFDYKVSTEEGGVDHQNAFEKLKEKLNVKQQPNPDHVVDEDQEFSDAPLSFQQNQEKSSDEKEFVDAPLSFQQPQESKKDESKPVEHAQEIHERVVYDATPPDTEEDSSSAGVQCTTGNDTDNSLSLADGREPSKDDENRKLESGGSSSSSSSEEGEDSSVTVDEESKPGFFSKVKQTLWKSESKTDDGHENEDNEQLDQQGFSSSFEKEHLPTSQPPQEKRTDNKASDDIGSPTVEDEVKPGFFSKVKQTIWKSESKNPDTEDSDMTELDKEEPPSSASFDEVAKPGFFGKVKQTFWKADDNKHPNVDHSNDESEVSKDLEEKGSAVSSDQKVGAKSASMAPPVKDIDERTSFVPTVGGETSVISPLSITRDADNVGTPANLPDKGETQVVKARGESNS